MFDNNQEQLQKGSGQQQLFTGLYPLRIVGINPTVEQLTNIIGEGASKFKVDYSVGQYGKPVTFWFSSPDNKVKPFSKTIFLKEETIVVQDSGKTMLLNDSTGQYGTVQSAWAVSPEDVPLWFSKDGIRPANKGEYEYYDLLVKFLRFRDKEGGKTYVEFLSEEKVDFASVINGDDSALHNLADYFMDNASTCVILLTVRSGEKNYQDCELGNCVFGQNSVTDKVIERAQKLNSNADYPISKNEFSFEFAEYTGASAPPTPKKVDAPAKKQSWI